MRICRSGGIEPPTDGRRIEAAFRWNAPNEPVTDYDRACDVAEYLGLLNIGGGQGLVLGGEPLGTARQAFPAPDAGEQVAGGILIRWVYANSEAAVIDAVDHVPEPAWIEDGLVLSVRHEPLHLIDAAYSASMLEGDDYLTIYVPAGTYSVATALYQPDRHTSLVLSPH